MKKLISAFALMFAMTMTASAVSIAWSSTAVAFGDSGTLKKDGGVTAYLVYLESGSFGTYTITDTFTAASVGTVVSKDEDGTNKGGLSTGTFQFDYGSYNDGDKFGLVLSYVSEGKKYWNISENVQALSGITSEIATPTAWNDYSVSTSVSTSSSASAGSGWTTVPEPSTAALALAGLALLLKRRKA